MLLCPVLWRVSEIRDLLSEKTLINWSELMLKITLMYGSITFSIDLSNHRTLKSNKSLSIFFHTHINLLHNFTTLLISHFKYSMHKYLTKTVLYVGRRLIVSFYLYKGKENRLLLKKCYRSSVSILIIKF